MREIVGNQDSIGPKFIFINNEKFKVDLIARDFKASKSLYFFE